MSETSSQTSWSKFEKRETWRGVTASSMEVRVIGCLQEEVCICHDTSKATFLMVQFLPNIYGCSGEESVTTRCNVFGHVHGILVLWECSKKTEKCVPRCEGTQSPRTSQAILFPGNQKAFGRMSGKMEYMATAYFWRRESEGGRVSCSQ